MLEIRCAHTDDKAQQCGRFLARLSGGTLQIFCPKCKQWHDVPVVEMMKATISEIPKSANGTETRLFL